MFKRLVVPGAIRRPELRLLIAGRAIPGLVRVSVTNNSHFQADTWNCQIAFNASGGQGRDWWGLDARKGELWDIRLRLDDGDECSFITGQPDDLRCDPSGGTIEATGRDLTARFIEANTQEAFQNRTASEIATLLAARHDMTAVVDPTTTLVGRYYGADHDRVTHDQFSRATREWDLLRTLAENEGYDLFVRGTVLHFQKAIDPAAIEPYRVYWDEDARRSDVEHLSLRRSLTLARDVVVKVRVWTSASGKGFTAYSPANGRLLDKRGGATVRLINRPNLTPQAAQQLADHLRDEITKHQRTFSFECPGEVNLTTRDMIKIDGVGEGWGGQPFFISSITRQLGMEGFRMQVEGKSTDPAVDGE